MESSFTSASDGSLSLVIYMLFLFLSHSLSLSPSLSFKACEGFLHLAHSTQYSESFG